MDIQALAKKVQELEEEVRTLKSRRITQEMIVPDVVKMRHIGEGPRFIRGGVTADKPTIGENATDSVAIYYDKTTNKLWIYNGSWVSTTLS